MTVANLWVGAVTSSSAWVRARVTGPASSRLLVSEAPDLSSPAYHGPVTPTGELAVSIEATGLTPNTHYWYAVEHDGQVDTDWSGSFRTHPPVGQPASYTVAVGSCAGSRNGYGHTTAKVSNHPVFDVLRTHPLDPLMVIHAGDLHYRDIAADNPAPYRQAYDDVLTFSGVLGADARQGLLYRHRPICAVWDDHDYGPNDSDRTAAGRQAAQQVYRERVPHYPLPAAGPIYHTVQIGRVLWLLSDVRSDASPTTDVDGPCKTMLGSAQLAWMATVLTTSTAEFLVWVNGRQWMGAGPDTWAGYTHERDQVVQMLGDTGWLGRMCIVSGDAHSLAVDTGAGNGWGGFPVFQFASLDSSPSSPTYQYDTGPTRPGRGQYGTVAVHDRGDHLAVTGTGWVMDRPWRWHTSAIPTP